MYAGCTSNLNNRIDRHQKGYIDSTKGRGPVKLIWHCVFEKQEKAYAFEKYLKSGSGRAFRNKHLI